MNSKVRRSEEIDSTIFSSSNWSHFFLIPWPWNASSSLRFESSPCFGLSSLAAGSCPHPVVKHKQKNNKNTRKFLMFILSQNAPKTPVRIKRSSEAKRRTSFNVVQSMGCSTSAESLGYYIKKPIENGRYSTTILYQLVEIWISEPTHTQFHQTGESTSWVRTWRSLLPVWNYIIFLQTSRL